MKIKELLEKFDITEKEYYQHRYNMTQSKILVHEDVVAYECLILFFDSDDGVALITYPSDMGDNIFSIELIECGYCNIGFNDMEQIIDKFRDFECRAENIVNNKVVDINKNACT